MPFQSKFEIRMRCIVSHLIRDRIASYRIVSIEHKVLSLRLFLSASAAHFAEITNEQRNDTQTE